MKKKLLLLIIGLFPILAFSQEGFEYATTSRDGTEYFIKTVDDSQEDYTKIWMKNYNKTKTIKNKKGKIVQTGGGYTLALLELSCDLKTYAILRVLEYNKNGTVISSNEAFSPTHKEIIPDSVISGVFNSVCSIY